MKTNLLLTASTSLLAGATVCQANTITGSFTGVITSQYASNTNFPSYVGQTISGGFSYDSNGNNYGVAGSGEYLHESASFGLAGSPYLYTSAATLIDSGANLSGFPFFADFLHISPDGASVSINRISNGSYGGSFSFSNGSGTGILSNDGGGIEYSFNFDITSATATVPDAASTLALMGFAISGLTGVRRFVR